MLATLALAATLSSESIGVMTYNIWVGGTRHQPISQTVLAIEASDADIVGVQEPGPNLEAIADGLDWNRSDVASVVSRFPIVEEWDVAGARWGGVRIETPLGELVVYNCHLTAYPYGPYEVRDGNATTAWQAASVEAASGRLAEVHAILRDMSSRVEADEDVVFVGDFNTPSHLDWVGDSAKFDLEVAWPVTVAVESMGFTDAYRAVFPDPVTHPGDTWSPGYPVGEPLAEDDVMDRIDLVFFRGPRLSVTDVQIVAETGPLTDIAVDPWPSDHRAVVARFAMD